MSKESRVAWMTYALPLAKLLLVPVFLWIVLQSISSDYSLDMTGSDHLLICLAVVVNQISLFVFSLRMRVMLGVFGIKISALQALRIHLQSVFYFYVLPMTVGLEAARFAKVKALVGSEVKAVTLVSALLADRLVGMLAALLLAAILLPFMGFTAVVRWDMDILWLVLAGVGALIGAFTLLPSIRFQARKVRGLYRMARRIHWVLVIVTIATHLLFSFGVYLAAAGLGLGIDFLQSLFVSTSAMLFVVIPLSFAGVSPVEAVGLGALLGLGVPMEQAVIFVSISYFAKLIAAIEGGGWEFYEGGEYVSRHLFKVRS